MTQRYDLVIAGGGPSGAAAAWQAAQTGAKVVVLDKAEFPRDKPCGDGLTARAVSYLQKMGLSHEVAEFHRVNRVTVFSPSQWELSFPKRPGMPDHGHTVSRTELDTLLLKHAESAGAEVRQSAEVTGPIVENGRVVGVTLKSGEKVYGDAVIAADGAYSPIKRALKIDSEYNGYSAIAIRSEMHANRPDSDSLDIYLKLAFQGDQLPGYGWVFPMGGGRFNIGLGYVNSYKNWQSINATQFLGEFLRTLPREWELPPIEELKKNKSVRAWRLPMGFTAWPPWRPGVLFTGDSLGAGKPASVRASRRRWSRDWPRARARSRRCRTAGPTTSPITRNEWKRRGAGSTSAAGTSTSSRASLPWRTPGSSSSTTASSATGCSRRCTRRHRARNTPTRSRSREELADLDHQFVDAVGERDAHPQPGQADIGLGHCGLVITQLDVGARIGHRVAS